MADDPSISDDDILYRRLHPDWITNDQPPRISSAAFQNYRGYEAFSANLDSLMTINAQTWQSLLAGHAGYGIATVKVADVRGLNRGVQKEPKPDDPSHVHVIGKETKGIKRRLAAIAAASVLKWPG